MFSSIATYFRLLGCNNYPTLSRKTDPKPLRIFLQDGANDLNIYGGNWFLANQEMLSALQFSGYEVTNVWGDGGHNGKHATAVFPDGLRWLWKDYPKPITAGANSHQPLMDVLLTNADWRPACAGHTATALAVNEFGQVFFYDYSDYWIHKFDIDGKGSDFVKPGVQVRAMSVGPDGRLYAAQPEKERIVAYDSDGRERVVVSGVNCFSLVVAHSGDIYAAEPGGRLIWRVDAKGDKEFADTGTGESTGLQLVPDQTFLNVAEAGAQFICSFQVRADGALTNKQQYFYLHLADGATGSGAAGMAVDTQGRLYVATDLGIQVCDQAGRVNYIITTPHCGMLSELALGGVNRDTLYAICGGRIFARQTKARGVLSFEPPIKPPAPRL